MATPSPAPPGENPLVPHALLRQLYATMQALRTPVRPTSAPAARLARCPRGEEAIYAAGLLSLRATDLLCTQVSPQGVSPEPPPKSLHLSSSTRPHERLLLALGAAAALGAQANGNLVLAFAAVDDLTPAQWQHVLRLASAQALPIVLIALPGKRPGWLSSHAQSWGVPGIPVDAADPVALTRVLQESTLRARHGDGPALLEPIAWTVGRPVDPLRTMQQLLQSRGLLSTVANPRPARPRGK